MAIGSLLPRNFLGGMLAGDQIQQQKQAAELQQAIGMASLLQRQKEAERQAQMDPLRMQLLQAQVGDAQQQTQRRQALEQAISQLPPDQQALARIAPQQFAASLFPKQEKPQVVAPGAALVSGGQEIYKNSGIPKDERTPFEKSLDRLNLPPEQKQQLLRQYIQKQTTHAPATNISLGPKLRYDQEGGFLVDERTGQTKPVVDQSGRPITMPKDEAKVRNAVNTANIVGNKVDEALDKVGGLTTGLPGSVIGKVAGTDAYNLNRAVDTIKANIGFRELQAMREASPTGGALGQVAVQELNFLQSAIASLDTAQGADELKANLQAVKTHFDNWKNALAQDFAAKYGRPPNVGDTNGGGSTGSPRGGNVPRISSDADYNALPRGTRYIAPDGKERIKQ